MNVVLPPAVSAPPPQAAKEKMGDFSVMPAMKSSWTGRAHPEEESQRNQMLEGAVMNHHTRTSVVQGIVDVFVTVKKRQADTGVS